MSQCDQALFQNRKVQKFAVTTEPTLPRFDLQKAKNENRRRGYREY